MAKIKGAMLRTVSPGIVSVPQNLNFSLAAIQFFANVLQFFILPHYLLQKSMHWSLVVIPLAVLNNPFWALIHEAIHDLFNSSSRTNVAEDDYFLFSSVRLFTFYA